ncbi:MAG: signal peptidase II [Butyribacter sp.]|nr:signal peptidase II [bacterium]MDY3853517.1 signal peptidase II [Butyribacter sp.]
MQLKKYTFGILGVVCFIVFDQLTKLWAILNLEGTQGIPVIPDVFELQYLENHGAAFGILQNQRWLLLIISFLILILLCAVYAKIPEGKRFLPLKAVSILLAAGAIGNMIDRILMGYVIDFLYFKLIHFPVFNVADCYVVIAAFAAFFLICFYYKDEDFNFLKKKKS